MDIAIYLIAGLIAAVALYPAFWLVVEVYRECRGPLVVTCPETGERAVIRLDAGRAAISRLFGQPSLRLKRCTQWLEHRDCSRRCLAAIHLPAAKLGTTPSRC
ncbi:MAG: hypothetical protein HY238_03935 [Acidobacteria bacterium]|nr:hypothetical protein [Acidobacteriota bacterium]